MRDRSAYVETRAVRQFAAVAASALIVAGFLGAGRYLWSAAALIGWAGILFPSALAPVRRIWLFLGGLIGRAVGVVAMGIAFYGVLTPVALFLHLVGRDALLLRPKAGRGSYWLPRAPSAATERYFRQF